MPAQPAWYHRLKEILGELRAIETSHLDRQAIEKLFGVAERRARELMAGLPYFQVGNAAAVSRLALIERLENIVKGDRFQWEVSRRARVAESLETLRKHAAGRRIQIAATQETFNRRLNNLIHGIELAPGELRIVFNGAGDLASKLFELSQAMANDWNAFTELVGEEVIDYPLIPEPLI